MYVNSLNGGTHYQAPPTQEMYLLDITRQQIKKPVQTRVTLFGGAGKYSSITRHIPQNITGYTVNDFSYLPQYGSKRIF